MAAALSCRASPRLGMKVLAALAGLAGVAAASNAAKHSKATAVLTFLLASPGVAADKRKKKKKVPHKTKTKPGGAGEGQGGPGKSSPECEQSTIRLEILTDDYGDETSWALVDSCRSTVVDSRDDDTLNDNSRYVYEYCRPSHEHLFIIRDSYGDGICCGWGWGEYKVFVDGVLEDGGGDFGNETQVGILGGGSCSPTYSPVPSATPTLSNAPTTSPAPTLNKTDYYYDWGDYYDYNYTNSTYYYDNVDYNYSYEGNLTTDGLPDGCELDLFEFGNCTIPLTEEECTIAAEELMLNWDANDINPQRMDKPFDHIPGGCFVKKNEDDRIIKMRYNPYNDAGTNCGQVTQGGKYTKLCVCCG